MSQREYDHKYISQRGGLHIVGLLIFVFVIGGAVVLYSYLLQTEKLGREVEGLRNELRRQDARISYLELSK